MPILDGDHVAQVDSSDEENADPNRGDRQMGQGRADEEDMMADSVSSQPPQPVSMSPNNSDWSGKRLP